MSGASRYRDAKDTALRQLGEIIDRKPSGPDRKKLTDLYRRVQEGEAQLSEIQDVVRKESYEGTNISVLPTQQSAEQSEKKPPLVRPQQFNYPESIVRAFGRQAAVGRPPDRWWGSGQGEGEASRRVVEEFRNVFGKLPTPEEARTKLYIGGYFLWHNGEFPGYPDEKIVRKLEELYPLYKAAKRDR